GVLARTRAPWRTCCGGMPCVMSRISASGAMRLITPWHVPTKSSRSPKSDRKVMNTGAMLNARGRRDGLDQAVEIVTLGLGDHLQAVLACFTGGLGANRDRRDLKAERGKGPRCGRGREHNQVAFRRPLGAKRARAIEDDRVGVERFRQVRPCVL